MLRSTENQSVTKLFILLSFGLSCELSTKVINVSTRKSFKNLQIFISNRQRKEFRCGSKKQNYEILRTMILAAIQSLFIYIHRCLLLLNETVRLQMATDGHEAVVKIQFARLSLLSLPVETDANVYG